MKISITAATLISITLCFVIAGCPQAKSGTKISDTQLKVEFENLTPIKLTDQLSIELDKTGFYPWSAGKGLLLSSPNIHEYVRYEINVGDDKPRNILFYGFRNKEYARFRMAVNDRPTGRVIDFYGSRGRAVDAFDIGTFTPKDGKLVITFVCVGKSHKAYGDDFGAAFDYLLLTTVPDNEQ